MKVCRVCLVQDHQDQEQVQFESVFVVREERTIAEIIMMCTGVEVSCCGVIRVRQGWIQGEECTERNCNLKFAD